MAAVDTPLPRVTIKFCTQCKWMLRAAYFAQELLSTFGTALGEVALQPSTGGTFIVEIFYVEAHAEDDDKPIEVKSHLLWDRKTEGGFPETKELKRRVRDVIEPGRDLGHVDGKKKSVASTGEPPSTSDTPEPHQTLQSQSSQDPSSTSARSGPEHKDKEPMMGGSKPEAPHPPEVQEERFTSMNVDTVGTASNKIKRNPDGTICEECN